MIIKHGDRRVYGGKFIYEVQYWIEMEVNGRKVESRPVSRYFWHEEDFVAMRHKARAYGEELAAAIEGLSPKEAAAKLTELVNDGPTYRELLDKFHAIDWTTK